MPVESRLDGARGNGQEAQLWLPTYAALCLAFLMSFFVLYAMPVLDQNHSQAQRHRQVVAMQARDFGDISVFIAQNGMEAGIEAVLEEDVIILRLPAATLFTPGAEYILPAGLNALNQLKDLFIIQHLQNINIRAYTDDNLLPPGTRFKNNWELTTLRAAHILRYLLAQGIEPGRLSAAGFGELEPLFPNTTDNNRAKNRRIEFVLERRPGKE